MFNTNRLITIGMTIALLAVLSRIDTTAALLYGSKASA